MSFWHAHALVDDRQAELRRQAANRQAQHRRPTAASVRTHTGARTESTPGLRQRLGILLVEAGLHLITVGR